MIAAFAGPGAFSGYTVRLFPGAFPDDAQGNSIAAIRISAWVWPAQ